MTEVLEHTSECEKLKEVALGGINSGLQDVGELYDEVARLKKMLRTWLQDIHDNNLYPQSEAHKIAQAHNCLNDIYKIKNLIQERRDALIHWRYIITQHALLTERFEEFDERISKRLEDLEIIKDIIKVNFERFEEIFPCEDFDMVIKLGNAAESHINSQYRKLKNNMIWKN